MYNPFALRVFESLDTDNKGYLIRNELFEMISINGLNDH
jgi:hypothetical protein